MPAAHASPGSPLPDEADAEDGVADSPPFRERLRRLDRRLFGRPGWARVLRNTGVGFIIQAGTRMAAALSYYALLAAGPLLVLTLALSRLLLGDELTHQIAAVAIQRLLPPSANLAAEIARQLVDASNAAAGLALVTGVVSLIGFTRALASSLNVMLNEFGSEPIQRTAKIVPLLYLAVLGLIWGAWMFEALARLVEMSAVDALVSLPGPVLSVVAPFVLAVSHFTIILSIVPRARLTLVEIVVPAVIGALLWEGARNIFGWLVGTDSFYLGLFGPLGGVVALLGWIYVSSVILVLIGQFTWAFAMERRGRGLLARHAPRAAGLERTTRPLEQDNAVNEAHQV